MPLVFRLILLACLASSLAAAQVDAARPLGRGSDPGVSKKAIKLGGVIDQTGQGSIIALHILAGYRLAIKERNAHGGIRGRKIQYTALSDGYDPSQTLPLVRQLAEQDHVFAFLGVFGSDDANQAAPYLEGHHIPFFDPIGGGVNVAGKHWIWQSEPSYSREGKAMAIYAATRLHARRVAVLYQVGIGEPQVTALRKTLPHYHASLVGTASYASTDTNLAGQVSRIRSHNPDLVVLTGTPIPTSNFVKYAALGAYHPKYGYLANYPMGDPVWVSLIGSYAEGIHVSSYADLTGKNKVASAYRRAITRFHGERYSNYGLYGYFNAMVMFKAIEDAGAKLNRTRLRSMLDSRFRNYSTGFAGRINWSPKDHYGSQQFKMYRIHNRQFVPVTGWINP